MSDYTEMGEEYFERHGHEMFEIPLKTHDGINPAPGDDDPVPNPLDEALEEEFEDEDDDFEDDEEDEDDPDVEDLLEEQN